MKFKKVISGYLVKPGTEWVDVIILESLCNLGPLDRSIFHDKRVNKSCAKIYITFGRHVTRVKNSAFLEHNSVIKEEYSK